MENSIQYRTAHFSDHLVVSPQLINVARTSILLLAVLIAVTSLVLGQRSNVITGSQAATLGPADTFTGTVWVTSLVPNDSIFTTISGSVAFEKGARSNWHSHPTGQILIVTDGIGYHQIKGEPKRLIHKGDVVKCLPNVVHWHGASLGSTMTHLYIIPNTEKGIVTWLQPVTDAEYGQK